MIHLTDQLQVVAGILLDSNGRVLLTQRLDGTHLAGTWEFPGGKVEPGETRESALHRELHEELGLLIGAIEPLISVPWAYPQKRIVLHAFRVSGFDGQPRGREGQALRWVDPADLAGVAMPPADRPIGTALRLPQVYAITDDPGAAGYERFLVDLEAIAGSAKLIQMRAKTFVGPQLQTLAAAAKAIAIRHGAALLLNGNIDIANALDIGAHLPAADHLALRARPFGPERWLAASCHDERELDHAAAIGADFAVLGPVLPTRSHVSAQPLGWRRFAALCARAPFPVYALGGLSRNDISAALAAGASGIAGISAFAAPRRREQ